jgi:GNAT superfamily N-acetyltransferase
LSDEPYRIEPLSGRHDRSAFTCGVEPLDRYFRQFASQDMRRRLATCFVISEAAAGTIAGYYTLAATNLLLRELPDAVAARLPRYPAIPAVLLGRLAVAVAFQGRRVGAVLLSDALTRSARADIGIFALVVDPKDEDARRFYRHHGLIDLPQPERRMFLPIESALRFFRAGAR